MFKLFKKYLKPFGGLVIVAILFTFLQVVAELQLPDIMARIVDTGIYNKDLNYVIVRGLEMLAWAIGSVVCVVIAALCAARAAMGFGRDVRAAIFSQVQSYSLAEFETFGASTLITLAVAALAMVCTRLSKSGAPYSPKVTFGSYAPAWFECIRSYVISMEHTTCGSTFSSASVMAFRVMPVISFFSRCASALLIFPTSIPSVAGLTIPCRHIFSVAA